MPVRPILRRAALLLGVLLVSLTGASAAASPAAPRTAEKELVTFGIGPGGQSYIDKRSFLSFGAAPGSQLLDKVAVFNQSNQPLTFLVYPSDGLTAKDGTLAIRPRAERNTDMGAWLTLGDATRTGKVDPVARSLMRITVPAQSRRTGIGKVVLPMRVIVPTDATPGDHVAGVVVALVSKGSNPSSQNIELEQRVALRVFLRVAGDIKAGLAVKILKADYLGGSGLGLKGITRVTYRVTNTGNVRLGADTKVSVKSWLGLGSKSVSGPALVELVPGGKAEVTADVKDTPPSIIQHASVTVTAKAAVGGQPVRIPVVSDRVRLWAITWQEVVLAILILMYLVYRRWRKSHRRERGQAKPDNVLESPVVAAGVVVLLAAAAFASLGVGRAHATELGPVHVSPTVGHDETLFDGSVEQASCPKGTNDSYFTIDGPGLPPNTGFLGQGSKPGTGPQSFRGASIANLRAANTDAFQGSGTYVVRFSCVRASDGGVSDSYVRKLRYEAGGKGSFQVLGYPKSQPTRFPLPGATPLDDGKSSPGSTAAPSLPGAARSASPSAPYRTASSAPSANSSPRATGAGTAAQANEQDEGTSRLLPIGLGLLVAAAVVTLLARRRRG